MATQTSKYSSQLVHPVTLISVSHEGTENIATMAWVSPVSFNPPFLMVAVSPKRFTHELILKSKEFALMVLTDEQKELSTLAGTKTGRKENKWDLAPFRELREEATTIRAPVLRGCRAVFECKLARHWTVGDHTLFVGEVIHHRYNDDKNPLILFNRRYFELGRFIAAYP
ncbi:MAG: flavin reductase family protein [Calditrichia bacterium]